MVKFATEYRSVTQSTYNANVMNVCCVLSFHFPLAYSPVTKTNDILVKK